ncbi:MAG: stage II sporulation protein M [Candidatus Bathyarchaeota archaeon]|nr:stage II sporulation protein M [Candidatus Bathyarchaeota archaeon]
MFLFIFSIAMGYSMGSDISTDVFEDVLSNIPEPTGSNNFEVFTALVSNNVMASFIFFVSGVLVGIPPLIFIVLNGFFVGWICYVAGSELGLGFVIATLLPHGVIEIPTITLAAAMGVGLGYQIVHKLRRQGGLQQYVTESLNVFVTRMIPFLIVAGAIETMIIILYT